MRHFIVLQIEQFPAVFWPDKTGCFLKQTNSLLHEETIRQLTTSSKNTILLKHWRLNVMEHAGKKVAIKVPKTKTYYKP